MLYFSQPLELGEPLVPRDVVAVRVLEREAARRCDDEQAEDPVRVARRDVDRPGASARQRDEDGAVDARSVHDRHGVGRVLLVRVCRGTGRASRRPAAAPVEGDDPEVAGQVGHLALPDPGGHDRPGRHEDQRGRARPERLPGEVDPVTRRDADLVGQARPAPGVRRVAEAKAVGRRHGGHFLTSNTLLNGVVAAILKEPNPAVVTMSRIRAGPAWVPMARPTSWERDPGVHNRVENP